MGLFNGSRDKPVKLGEIYRDEITGFQGVATGRYEYLYGCVRVTLEEQKVQPDGKVIDVTFDEQRLTNAPSATSGGPRDEAWRRA